MRLELPKPYRLRDVMGDDADALFAIHRAAMYSYIDRIWGWDDAWQEQYFYKDFPPANQQVICDSDLPIGSLSLHSSPQWKFIGSIKLHPDYQDRGIGTFIFNQLIHHSEESEIPLRLQVFKINNRARALYERLGFNVIGQTEHHDQMERVPGQPID